jgi:outer membrane protein OmpA-like peptidoglycan-associated protein
MISFTPSNGLGDDLPRNITGEYSTKSLVMPIGAGLQYSLDDRLSVHGQALFYVNASDYLDGYAHFVDYEDEPGTIGPGEIATPPDYPITFTVGLSYAFYRPEPPAYQPPVAAQQPQPQPQQEQPQPEQGQPQVEAVERRDPPTTDSVPMMAAMPDSDADGLSDSSENERFMTNPSNPDSDGDGLKDYDEIYRHNTSPNHGDTDRDGLGDANEVLVYNTDPLDADTDNDLLVDGDEVNGTRTDAMYASALSSEVMAVRQATDPLDADTDGDGVPDGLDACPTVAGESSLRGCPAIATGSSPVESVGTGYRADFEGITFRPNTDDFDFSRPQTQRDLSRLLSLVNQCDDIGVLIEGHSSSEGDAGWNQRLSAMRARRVYQWLVANGVPERKLFGSVGYGSRLPKVSEVGTSGQLEELRTQNRRITALVRKPC